MVPPAGGESSLLTPLPPVEDRDALGMVESGHCCGAGRLRDVDASAC